MKRDFQDNHSIAILSCGGSAAQLPCNLDGGSPFLLKDCSRVTGSIFILPHNHYYRFCGLASPKPKSDSSGVRRRVDRSSTESSTKKTFVALPLSFISMRLQHV